MQIKRHLLNFHFLPSTCLFGISISQYHTKTEGSDKWHPAFDIEIGLIFFKVSYVNISIS
mgnify:CR=1 FL=1